ncbi:uncharacterized protein LOC130137572 [Syzygium oleosum]|uniref:uncharacterized protein LOC130137572 n=1 Tax=Syzygium oleosum TaxID=219896 RepID=UPI0024BB308D|nr:uncharacterized protein LOC130137572 [Syzygium oleosum]
MYFDGAVNLSRFGTGAVLISLADQHYPVAAKLIFPCTNNISECEACILGLQLAIDMKVKRLQVYGDSALIILQTGGEWQTRDSKLIPYHEYLKDLVEEFEEILFDYLPRSLNQFADALATLSSMLQVTDGLNIDPLQIDVLKELAYCMVIEKELDGQPWYCDIMNYLREGKFPHESRATEYLTKLASKFFLSGGALYKRSFDSVLLKCVDTKEANLLMKDKHEGECGPHMNDHLLARKIMRLSYY